MLRRCHISVINGNDNAGRHNHFCDRSNPAMTNPRALAALATVACLSATAQAGVVTTDGADIIVNTNSGLEVKTADGETSFKLGGRLQLDGSTWDGATNKGSDDWGSDLWFRRARIELAGKSGDWGYEAAYNLVDSGSIQDANISYEGWGSMFRVVAGQQKEDFGMEDTQSSKWITFIERSMPTNAFETGQSVGLKLTGANDALTYSVGVYRAAIDADDNSLDEAWTGRFVYRPILADDGTLLHLGIGATLRNGSFEALGSRLARGGEDGNASKVQAAYTAGEAEELLIYNFEAAGQLGSGHIAAEYFIAEASDNEAAGDMDAEGFYVELGYVLTGEQRGYKNAIAAFDKVKPASAGGAWELTARYDQLDVDNDDPLMKITGEVGSSYTVGLNWYATQLVKIMANYSYVEVDKEINDQDDGNVFSMRAQYAF